MARTRRYATGGIAALAIRLIRLPSWIAEELADFADISFEGRRLPTGIHGLSPNSRFLQALNQVRLVSPAHSIIGEHDDVAPASSAHVESAQSEVLVPAGHGGFADPMALEEIKRILVLTADN